MEARPSRLYNFAVFMKSGRVDYDSTLEELS